MRFHPLKSGRDALRQVCLSRSSSVSIPSSRVGTRRLRDAACLVVKFPSPQVGSGLGSDGKLILVSGSFHPLKSGRDKGVGEGSKGKGMVSIPSSRVGTCLYSCLGEVKSKVSIPSSRVGTPSWRFASTERKRVSIPSSRVGTRIVMFCHHHHPKFPSPQVGSGRTLLFRPWRIFFLVSIPSSRVGTPVPAVGVIIDTRFPSPQVGSGR